MQLTRPLHEDSPQWKWFKSAVVTTIKKNGKVDYDTKIRLTSTIIWCLGAFDVVRKTIHLTYQGKVAPWNAKYNLVEKKTRQKYPNTLKGRIALNKVLFAFFRASQVEKNTDTGTEAITMFGMEKMSPKRIARLATTGTVLTLMLVGGYKLTIGRKKEVPRSNTVAEQTNYISSGSMAKRDAFMAYSYGKISDKELDERNKAIDDNEKEYIKDKKMTDDDAKMVKDLIAKNGEQSKKLKDMDDKYADIDKRLAKHHQQYTKTFNLDMHAVNSLTTSNRGIAFIKKHEGLRLKAYNDGTGVITVGWGHTGDLSSIGQAGKPKLTFKIITDKEGKKRRVVDEQTVITQAEAETLLAEDIRAAEQHVKDILGFEKHNVKEITQSRFDVLVSFVFNKGREGFRTSELRAEIARGPLKWSDDKIEQAFTKGAKMGGHKTRRQEEADRFLGGYTPDNQ
jgi:lysozyme